MAQNWGREEWETMVQQVVVDGRPGDLRTAALGWEATLRNLNTVKTSLDNNVKELGTAWKGEAYEAFKKRIEEISKKIQQVADQANGAEGGGSIVLSLNTAASDLSDAQAKMPVPLIVMPQVLEARDAYLTIQPGFFENALKVDVAGAGGKVLNAVDWATGGAFSDAANAIQDFLGEGDAEARAAWNQLNNQVANTTQATPEGTPVDKQDFNPSQAIPPGGSSPGGGVGSPSGGDRISG